jgi:hypothetical protein
MPNILKVGYTTRSLSERLAELNSSTSVPSKFKIEYYVKVSHGSSQALEKNVHTILKSMGCHHGKEFFNCSLDDCKDVINEAIELLDLDAINSETRAFQKKIEAASYKMARENERNLQKELVSINEKYMPLLNEASSGGSFIKWWIFLSILIESIFEFNGNKNSIVLSGLCGSIVAALVVSFISDQKMNSKKYQYLLEKKLEEVEVAKKKFQ